MSVAQYAYLNTRISLFAGQLLGHDRIESLIDRPYTDDMRNSVRADVAEQYTVDMDQNNVTLLLKELAVLIRPLSGASRELLSYWAHRFELGNLKAIIRGKMTGQPRLAIEEQLQDMGGFTSLPIDALLQSDTPAELLRRLEQTPYIDIARQARRLLEQGEALFALDAALDRRYYAGLARRGMTIDNRSGQLLRSLTGSIVDRVNLVWLLRYRYAYNLSPAQAYYLLIPSCHRLLPLHMRQLAQCTSFDEAIGSLSSPFDRILAGVGNTTEVTLKLEHESWRIATGILRHTSFNVARALAYMMLRERDLRRLRAIASGRSMKMEPAAIRSALGLDAISGGMS